MTSISGSFSGRFACIPVDITQSTTVDEKYLTFFPPFLYFLYINCYSEIFYLFLFVYLFICLYYFFQLFWESDDQPTRRNANVTFQETGNSSRSPGETMNQIASCLCAGFNKICMYSRILSYSCKVLDWKWFFLFNPFNGGTHFYL